MTNRQISRDISSNKRRGGGCIRYLSTFQRRLSSSSSSSGRIFQPIAERRCVSDINPDVTELLAITSRDLNSPSLIQFLFRPECSRRKPVGIYHRCRGRLDASGPSTVNYRQRFSPGTAAVIYANYLTRIYGYVKITSAGVTSPFGTINSKYAHQF
ncbi:hypothetical protein J6590_090589 [Homalodisca vitripennis]|nr:hypothetical protein J6590_090589 [Homalodisca vitripennis]